MKINLHLLSEKRQTIYKFYKLKFLSNGKPMKKMEDGLVFHPILAPYLINDFLDIYEKKNIKEALDIAVHIANISFKEADLYRGALCFWYDPKDKLSAMPNKFFSGLTQSWYVKASARLSKHNNNFIPTIQLFFNSLLIPIELGGVLVKKDIGWIIEEYPSKPQLYTLNGWLTVLRWLINDEESLKHLPSYYEFLEKNLDAVKHLLPLYDAGFCFNSRYQLTGFTRFRMVFPSDIKFKIEGFSIHIPGDGDFNGSLNKEDVSRWGNYVERNEGRLLQFNIIMSLISYPKVNQFNGSLWTSRKCTVKCFLADGSYDPSSTAMPTNGWREVATISLKEGNNNVEIDLSYDENNMFAYPTNFKKYIYQDRGKTFNAYHFVHIADLAAIYKFTKDRFFYKYCKKWITYMDEWPALECLLPKKYSYEHFLGGGYMENVQKMLKKEIIENECVVCGECLTGKEDRGICSSCKCRPRVRTIVDLFQSNIIPEFGNIINFSGANLCFAMTSHERTLLSKYYNRFESVSLFGKYGNEHTEGVDARDLSRFEDGSFSTHYSCLLFDYFVEHEAALKEAYRVLAFNGMFVTHIERPRILDDSSAPFSTASIKPRKGYYEYIPDSEGMLSVKVGKDWFLNTMKKIGFKSFVYTILDRASGVISDWFVGYKIDQFLPEKYNVKLIHEASKNIHKKKKDILVPAKKNVSKKEKSITSKTLKEYSIPLPNGHPSKHITIRLSIPEVTKTKKYVRFSEHSIDLNTGVASNRVIACSVGGFFISENLGDTWNWVSLEGYKKVKFINSFTLPDDSICLQSIGASLGGDLKEQPSAELIVCNANGKIYTKSTLGASSWHGSSSVDFRDGTLIFADYAINKPRTHGVQDRFDSNVFRSVDGGFSWEKVFKQTGDKIRHFHTVRCDPYVKGTWYLTSGDLAEETNFWISTDDGINWKSILNKNTFGRERFRLTDMVFTEDGLIWGSDDILGNPRQIKIELPLSERVGARLFFAKRNALDDPVEIGYVGQAVRSITELDNYYLVMTQGTIYDEISRPSVFLLTKKKPYKLLHLFDVDNYSDKSTGFTYSMCSRKAKDGVFFSVRGNKDVFKESTYILKWEVSFE